MGFVFVGVVLFLNKGDFGGCGKSVDISNIQTVGCGVERFKDLVIAGRTFENYVAFGEVMDLRYKGGKM